jgi:hypothetical protein
MYQRRVYRPAGKGEVFDAPEGMNAIQGIGRNFPFAEEVFFDSESGG